MLQHVLCRRLPFSIIRSVSAVFFRDRGVSLEAVGLTTFFALPWILKFFWGPLVDEFATKKRWLLAMQAALAVLIGAAAFLVPLPAAPRLIAILFFAGAFVAATHDIAIDGYYLAALDKVGQTKFLGYRVMAYRVAMLFGTGVIVTIGTSFSWTAAFLCAGLLLGLLAAYHSLFLPECETERRPVGQMLPLFARSRVLLSAALIAAIIAGFYLFFNFALFHGWEQAAPFLKELNFSRAVGLGLLLALALIAASRKRLAALLTKKPESFYGRAFLTFMDQEKIGLILAFIILVRSGEFMASAMTSPFMIDLGIKAHYGWIAGGIGLPASIAGALIGGWMISRFGLKRVIWPFLLAQNLTNVVYSLLARGLSAYLTLNTSAAHPVFMGAGNLALTACARLRAIGQRPGTRGADHVPDAHLQERVQGRPLRHWLGADEPGRDCRRRGQRLHRLLARLQRHVLHLLSHIHPQHAAVVLGAEEIKRGSKFDVRSSKLKKKPETTS